MTTTTQETRVLQMDDTLPKLYIPHPKCSHCDKEVTIEDDSAYCESCLVTWERIEDGEAGKPDDGVLEEPEVACEIVVGKQDEPFERNGRRYVPGPPKPCILPAGHDGSHLNPHDVEVSNA